MESAIMLLACASCLKKPTRAQLARFVFESGLMKAYDFVPDLVFLTEKGYLKQSVGDAGLQYEATKLGLARLKAEEASIQNLAEIRRFAADYIRMFAVEQDYIAEYTEQANGIIPVFLSIRRGEKVLYKVSIIVPDVETAQRIKRDWPKNAEKAYRNAWKDIAEGMPFPSF